MYIKVQFKIFIQQPLKKDVDEFGVPWSKKVSMQESYTNVHGLDVHSFHLIIYYNYV